MKAADSGFQLVDLELQSAQALKAQELQALSDRTGLILSYHNFRNTKKLEEPFEEMSQIPADFYKIVSTATNLYDNVVMMKFHRGTLGQAQDGRLVHGRTRHHQPSVGRAGPAASFTFGAATRGEETAPGQATAMELRDTYRIETVDAATQVYGIAGDPVEHSLSPVMMNAAFRREAVNAVCIWRCTPRA